MKRDAQGQLVVEGRRRRWGYASGAVFFALSLLATSCMTARAWLETSVVEVDLDSPPVDIEGGVRLTAPEPVWDGYGEAVDVRGHVFVVGASAWNVLKDRPDAPGRGTAYVYRFRDGTWREEARLRPGGLDGGQLGPRFGTAVALGDGVLAIGAPGADDVQAGQDDSGAVYIFEYDGDTWTETEKLTPELWEVAEGQTEATWLTSPRMRPRAFGALVAIDGNTLAVGGEAATNSITVFERGAGGWLKQARIAVPTRRERDLYMTSLALFRNIVAVSVFYVPPQQVNEGLLTGEAAVYVFERTGDSWRETLRFTPEMPEGDFIYFREVHVGAFVALGAGAAERTVLAVGLPGFPDWRENEEGVQKLEPVVRFPEPGLKTGLVTLFEREQNGGWQHRATLTPAGAKPPPGPGFSVTEEGLTTGNPDNLPANSVFPGNWYSEKPEITFFGATVDVDGDLLAATAGYANATYVFERQGESWLYRYRVTAGERGAQWEDFAQVAALSGDTLLLGTPGEFGNSAHVFRLPADDDDS